ncbi:hypothetical protein J4E89_000363 [Alternaria sp. Ai002NY15]|nr:hypothetical protein J4E89_000363 [Alternaria sp. Ai002NY15]
MRYSAITLVALTATSTSAFSLWPRQSSSCPSVWSAVATELQADFAGCGADAHQALRAPFHDCINNGCDGSLVLTDECGRSENAGLSAICTKLKDWSDKYQVSAADMIQFAGAQAIAACPLGPRVQALVGRKDSSNAAPVGSVPSSRGTLESILGAFAAKGFSSDDVVALMGAHSVAVQFHDDPSQAGKGLDSTPFRYDNTFYQETKDRKAPYSLQSDLLMSNSSETSTTWSNFAEDANSWSTAFTSAWDRFAVIGSDASKLQDCSSLVPNGFVTTKRQAFNMAFTKKMSAKFRFGRKRALEPAVDAGPPAATSTRRKRARKEVINDKSLLLKLPGELRNRIYEYIMEDVKEHKKGTTSKAPKRRGGLYRTFDNDEPIYLRYTSIKPRKRYKTAKQWAVAHDRRPYFGLTQTCRTLREEFRPLYVSEIGFSIDLGQIGQYLAAFGSNEEEKIIGQSAANISQSPLSEDGADLLPVLERFRELKQPRLIDDHPVIYGGERYWDCDSLFALICFWWHGHTLGISAEAKSGITKITFVKRPDAERDDPPNDRPMLVIDLDANVFVSQTHQTMDAHMRRLISGFGLRQLNNTITQFRCGHKRFTYTTGAAEWYGVMLYRLALVHGPSSVTHP